jgi:CheY-like chemotaxis protein
MEALCRSSCVGSAVVLVVDDDHLVRNVAVEILHDMGYRTLAAPNAEVALLMLKEGIVADLLFTDIVMPGGKNGLELADAARAMRPELPVLFTTGFANALEGRRGDPLLRKPYRLDELRDAVVGAIGPADRGPRS